MLKILSFHIGLKIKTNIHVTQLENYHGEIFNHFEHIQSDYHKQLSMNHKCVSSSGLFFS